jgi:hypothetical protein
MDNYGLNSGNNQAPMISYLFFIKIYFLIIFDSLVITNYSLFFSVLFSEGDPVQFEAVPQVIIIHFRVFKYLLIFRSYSFFNPII